MTIKTVETLRDFQDITVLAALRARVNQVLEKAKTLGVEVDTSKVTLWSSKIKFECPIIHRETGIKDKGCFNIDLRTGEVTLDQVGPRALRISLKKRLTIRNNILRWMLLQGKSS